MKVIGILVKKNQQNFHNDKIFDNSNKSVQNKEISTNLQKTNQLKENSISENKKK